MDRLAVLDTSWTGSKEGDVYESIGSVIGTYNSGVCISKLGEPDVG